MREKIVAAAKEWLRTPFHHNARIKGAGCDCLQLLIAVFSEVGLLNKTDFGDYTHDWHMHHNEEKYLEGVMKHAKKVEAPQPGDVALFRFGRCVSHAAIVVDWPLVIHAYHNAGVVYAGAYDAELRGRLHSFWSML